ncbi:MAG: hypothetical protein K2L51_05650 [Clostridiales bacterium]|nr:hypothetical protein [Clostridiales bacterium]
MRKYLTKSTILCILILCICALAGCGEIWFKDKQSKNPDYHPIVSDSETSTDTDNENTDTPPVRYATFTLQLRQPSKTTETEDWDAYPHSELDGELIAEWEIPVFGNTIYESVKKYFADKDESFTFRVSQHKFYMFHDCTLSDGTTYNLETVYIAVDGVYANCANYQSLLGDDGIAGTDDDVQTVILVYKGWIYG